MEIERIEVEVPQPVTETRYVLTLTETEARLLKDVVGNIAGAGKRRDVVTDIYYGLEIPDYVDAYGIWTRDSLSTNCPVLKREDG